MGMGLSFGESLACGEEEPCPLHPSPQNGVSAYKMLLKSKSNVRGAFEEVPFQYNHSGGKESRLIETFRVRLEEK